MAGPCERFIRSTLNKTKVELDGVMMFYRQISNFNAVPGSLQNYRSQDVAELPFLMLHRGTGRGMQSCARLTAWLATRAAVSFVAVGFGG